eukprot:COSAG06_NODE_1620_length_8905_cov_255.644788_1_plen_71_part_00
MVNRFAKVSPPRKAVHSFALKCSQRRACTLLASLLSRFSLVKLRISNTLLKVWVSHLSQDSSRETVFTQS